MDVNEEYQATVSKNNELRRTLNKVILNRKRIPPHKLFKFEALVARIRHQINEHSELIAKLEESIAAERRKAPAFGLARWENR